jgi:predicted secreted hydrolase
VLTADDFEARPRAHWRDSSGVRWPLEWELDLPSENLALAIGARFEAQRWSRSVPYWEGSVSVSERNEGQAIGQGYLELSGYAPSDRQ